MGLKEKVVVIFGGSKGIGQSIALRCAEDGMKVIIAARSESDLRNTKTLIQNSYNTEVEVVTCDVGSMDQVENVYKMAEEKLGQVYAVICCSGIYGPIGPFDENNFEDWEAAININLLGTARCVYASLDNMKKRKCGRIVLMSGGGQGPLANFSSYVSSKGGIWRFTETLAEELAPYNIFINAIAPGAVNTTFLDEILKEGPSKVGDEFYQKSLHQKESGGTSPKKASECARYLLSRESSGLTGKILSAVWDPYNDFTSLKAMSNSDIFTMKRVVDEDGSTRPK